MASNHFTETPMDIEDFSNSLGTFDDFQFVHHQAAPNQSATAGDNQLQPQQIHQQQLMDGGASFAGGLGNNGGANSTSMSFTSGSSTNNNSSVFGSINSSSLMSDQLGLVDMPLYEGHLPMGHDYSLELFDDLRIPTDSMSWNEVDFPIYGK